MMKFLIADDHPLMRRGIRDLLREAFPDLDVGEAATGQEVEQLVRTGLWDLVLLDVSMPGGDGLETLVRVKRALPAVPVFVLSMHAEEQFAVRALKAGAAGYLTKDRAPEELVTAVKRVLAGGRYVTQTLAERLVTEISGDAEAAPHERLSQQEYRVMCLIAAGNTVSEIAELMHLSVKTVSTYRMRILEKLRLRTSAELTYYCVKHGLVA